MTLNQRKTLEGILLVSVIKVWTEFRVTLFIFAC